MINLINMLTKINNSQKIFSLRINNKKNNLCIDFLKFLLRLGYIRGFAYKNSYTVEVLLKYSKGSTIVFKNIRFISTPGHRVYTSLITLLKLKEYKLKTYVIFTNLGIVTLDEALKLKVGGEVFCVIE